MTKSTIPVKLTEKPNKKLHPLTGGGLHGEGDVLDLAAPSGVPRLDPWHRHRLGGHRAGHHHHHHLTSTPGLLYFGGEGTPYSSLSSWHCHTHSTLPLAPCISYQLPALVLVVWSMLHYNTLQYCSSHYAEQLGTVMKEVGILGGE